MSLVVRLASRGRVKCAGPLRCHGVPVLWAGRGCAVSLGEDAVLVSAKMHNPVQPARRCSLRTVGDAAMIEVGAGLRATGATICARERITIGDGVYLGSDVLIVDSDFHALDAAARKDGRPGMSRPTAIEDDVWIGARAIVLKGVRVGARSVIGAGSVVTSDIPQDVIAAGNPCRVLRGVGDDPAGS